MLSPAFLVYGHYGRGNVGDELMKQALISLLKPKGASLRFVDHIDEPMLQCVSGVIFGGGSILFDDPDVTPEALESLLTKQVPVFYVGVGGEMGPSKVHQRLIDVAKLVAFRELDTPDLAYVLADGLVMDDERPDPQGLLFVPNVEVLPTYDKAHWEHVAWEHFKNEAAQFLDRCTDRGMPVSFLLMCSGDQQADAWPAGELVGRMKRRAPQPKAYLAAGSDVVHLLRCHQVVVTQRYHGIVLAEMAGVPYVSIDHHDKLKHACPHRGTHVSYHGVQKDALTDTVELALATKLEPYRVPRKAYDDLVDKIIDAVKNGGPGVEQVRSST